MQTNQLESASPSAQRVVAVPTTVRIGSHEWPFTSYADASAAYRAAIDATDATAGCGSSGNVAPDCALLDANGVQCGKVSYNGKVWACTAKTKYECGLALLFSPYAATESVA